MKYESLITWTNHVFGLIKEQTGTSNATYQKPEEANQKPYTRLIHAIEPEDFLNLMHQYTARTAQSMDNEDVWLDQKKPLSSFFTFDDAMKRAGTDTTREHREMEVWENEHLFVQKIDLPEGSNVSFFGDYHGSIHSCIRNLWRLVASGHLDTDFRIIKDNFYIVGLGDYVDRGWFGLEVIYTLLLLKLAPGNWDKVFLVKGNHETINQAAWEGGGNLTAEIDAKYGPPINSIMINGETKPVSDIMLLHTLKWFTFLPEALFISNGNNEYVQCSHGGIDQGYDYALLEHGKGKNFQKLDGLYRPYPNDKHHFKDKPWSVHTGLNWSDFFQTAPPRWDGDDKEDNPGSERGCGISPVVKWTNGYLNQHPYLKGFFRGHQDLFFGFKMLFKPEAYPTKEEFVKRVNKMEEIEAIKVAIRGVWEAQGEKMRSRKHEECEYGLRNSFFKTYTEEEVAERRAEYASMEQEEYDAAYESTKKRYASFYALAEDTAKYTHERGPFHWKLVVSEEDQKSAQGFLIDHYFPVFTFTSAPFGRGVEGNYFPFDCYGTLNLAGNYETWRLTVYENILSPERGDKYCLIDFAQKDNKQSDSLLITWTEDKTDICCPENNEILK